MNLVYENDISNLKDTHCICIKKGENKSSCWTKYIIPIYEKSGNSREDIGECISDLIKDKKLSPKKTKATLMRFI